MKPASARPAGEQCAPSLRDGRPSHEQYQREEHDRDRHRLEYAVRGTGEPGRELGHELAEPPTERRVMNPVALTGAVLRDGERDQAQTAEADQRERELDRSAVAVDDEQPDRFGHDG